MTTGSLLLSLAVALGVVQERPDVGLFRAIVTAAAAEAGFSEEWANGRPVIVDLVTFRAAAPALAVLTEQEAVRALQHPLRSASFDAVEDCSKPGRWRCGITDDGLHLELLSMTRDARDLHVRVRSRRYSPGGVSGLCPREIVFSFRPTPGQGYALQRTVVDGEC